MIFVTFVVSALAAIVTSVTAAQSPSGTLLVLNKEDATLAIVDPANGKILGRVPTGEGPHEVVVSTDGKLAFVSNYGGATPGNTISVIDLAAQKELRRVDVSPLRRPHGLAFADGKLYFTAEVNRIVARYDPAANQIDWMLGTGQTTTHMLMINKEATRIYTANIGGNSVGFLERGANAQNWNVTIVPVGLGPEGMDLSPDGKEIWAAHSSARDGGVSIVDVATKKVVETIDLKTRRSNRLKFTTDGKLVLISDYDSGDLIVLDVATRKEIKRLPLGKNPTGILIVPDGTRACVAVNGDGIVAVVDLKSLEVTIRIASGVGPDGMAWVTGATAPPVKRL